MTKRFAPLLSLLLLCLIFAPFLIHAQAQGDIVPCSGPDCGYPQLIRLIVNIINKLIILSSLFATAALAYAGYLLLTSAGNPSEMSRAKEIGGKILKGYLWILIAWLVVYTITSALLGNGYFTLLGKPQ